MEEDRGILPRSSRGSNVVRVRNLLVANIHPRRDASRVREVTKKGPPDFIRTNNERDGGRQQREEEGKREKRIPCACRAGTVSIRFRFAR